MKPISIENPDQLTVAFSKKDRKEFWAPAEVLGLRSLEYPVSWVHRSGHLGYVLCAIEDRLVGVRLHRNPIRSGQGVQMCEWCKSVSRSGGVSLFTKDLTGGRSIGVLLCTDLGCRARVASEVPAVHGMRESLSLEERLGRLERNTVGFLERVLAS